MQIPRLQPRQGDSEGQESLASTGHKALTSWCQGEHRGPRPAPASLVLLEGYQLGSAPHPAGITFYSPFLL